MREMAKQHDWLLFYVLLKNFSLTIIVKELENLVLCSALRAFEQGRGASVFTVSSNGTSHSVASYDTQGDVEDQF
jgi:hypothetical protein